MGVGRSVNVSSENHFSFRCLPTVVLDHIVHYLDQRDRGNMAQVNRYLRKVLNSPRLWKGIEIRIHFRPGRRDRNFDPHFLKILRVRGITNLNCDFESFDLQIPTLQPHLERLSLRITDDPTFRALFKAASTGYLNHLKSLAFGRIDPCLESIWPKNFLDLFKCLPMMEEVSLGCSRDLESSPTGMRMRWRYFGYNKVFLTDKGTRNPLSRDLKQALCYSGKLTSLSLICLEEVGKSWLNTVMINNPHMQSLSLSYINTFSEKGSDDAVDLAACSNLRTFQLNCVPCTGQGIHNKILSWVFPEDKPYENVTALSFNPCEDPTIYSVLVKFPALKKLDLSGLYCRAYWCSPNQENNFSLPNFQNLEWLELQCCHGNLMGNGLLQLSENAGKNLKYLGLACTELEEDCLRNLPAMFPALRTLDLSGCCKLTDATLAEWYVKPDESEWPKLRKLVLYGCLAITQDVLDSIRLKTKNQLLIEHGD